MIPAEAVMAMTKDVQTALASPRTAIATSAVATEPVWYVNITKLIAKIFTNLNCREKVECKSGKWTEVRDCGKGTCHGGNDGGAVC